MGFLHLQIERLSGCDGCIVRQLAACALHNQEHCILRGQAVTSRLRLPFLGLYRFADTSQY